LQWARTERRPADASARATRRPRPTLHRSGRRTPGIAILGRRRRARPPNITGSSCMKAYVAAALGLPLAACQPDPSTAPDAGAASAEGPPARPLVDPGHVAGVLGGLVEQDRVVGVSALVYERGREAYFGAFGMADREAGRPMQRDTVAQIHSMTKPVTGVALMTRSEERRVGKERRAGWRAD